MGSDGLIELDEECWTVFAKFNLLLATVFGVLALTVRLTLPGHELLVIENGVLSLVFGSIRTYGGSPVETAVDAAQTARPRDRTAQHGTDVSRADEVGG